MPGSAADVLNDVWDSANHQLKITTGTAAAALADATANPTTEHQAADLFTFNGVTWDRLRGEGSGGNYAGRVSLYGKGTNAGDTPLLLSTAGRQQIATSSGGGADAQQGSTNFIPASDDVARPLGVMPYLFNGSNSDRVRSSSVGTGILVAAPPDFSFTNLAANATTTVKSGAGILHAITINTLGTADTITVYDNTAGSGTKIGTINAAVSQGTMVFNAKFSTGLTLVLAGTTPPDISVVYR